MIQDLRNRTEKMQEVFTKDLEELKNKQTEMKNTLEGINSRIMEVEGRINDQRDKMVEITTTEQNTEKEWKKKYATPFCFLEFLFGNQLITLWELACK